MGNRASWECGSTDHKRRDCHVVTDLIAKHGSIPRDHKTAYQIDLENSEHMVSALHSNRKSAAGTEDLDDNPKRLATIPHLGCGIMEAPACAVKSPFVVSTKTPSTCLDTLLKATATTTTTTKNKRM